MTKTTVKQKFEEPTVKTVWNALNVRKRLYRGQSFNLPSMTIPDQTMSMRTIVERFAKGMPPEVSKEPIFQEEDDESTGVNPRTLDLVELQELKMKTDEKIKKLSESLNAESKRRQELIRAEKQKIRDDLKAEIAREQAAESLVKQH